MTNSRRAMNVFVAGLTMCGLVACGGGGGGGGSGDTAENFGGAAFLGIQASPSNIDTGDRVQVDVALSNISDNGIALKIKTSTALRYVLDSAEIRYGETKRSVTPTVNTSVDSDRFVVFYMKATDFGSEKEGILHLEVEGMEAAKNAMIEVDADVDDPLVANNVEFSESDPRFTAEDAASIEITG